MQENKLTREVTHTRYIIDVNTEDTLTDYKTLAEVKKGWKTGQDIKIITEKINDKNVIVVIRKDDIFIYKYKMVWGLKMVDKNFKCYVCGSERTQEEIKAEGFNCICEVV